LVVPREGPVKDIERLFLIACGFEDDGQEFRLFLEGPNPLPSVHRHRGVRTNLFYLFPGDEAEAIRRYVTEHPEWERLRVPEEKN
jgi:hypothetical protein